MRLTFLERSLELSLSQLCFTRIRRFLRTGYILDISNLRDLVRGHIGDITFMEAYEKTGRVLNITVMPANMYGTPRVLNYLTAPNVVVWSASVCSCAIPALFQAQELLQKSESGELVPFIQEGVEFSDGSFGQDIPTERLSQLFNVNHFIVSQVNPHILPFLLDSQFPKIVRLSIELFVDEMICLTRWLCKLGKEYSIAYFTPWLTKIHNLATQQYVGDITIHPSPHAGQYFTLLNNPTEAEKLGDIRIMRKLTWRKLAQIKVHCGVEFCLDECLRHMKNAIVTTRQKQEASQSAKVDNPLGSPSSRLRRQRSRVESWTPEQFDRFNSYISPNLSPIDETQPDYFSKSDEEQKEIGIHVSLSEKNLLTKFQERDNRQKQWTADADTADSWRDKQGLSSGGNSYPDEEKVAGNYGSKDKYREKTHPAIPRSLSYAELLNENITAQF